MVAHFPHREDDRHHDKPGGRDRSEQWTGDAPPTRDSSLDPAHVTSTVPTDYHQVLGWGVDLDPKNRPMFPRERHSDVKNVRGKVRYWQVPHQKVHVSIEHPNITPVFGTASPPKGLSGLLRNYAYHYSEGTNRHWMTLVIADRIDVIESLISDALRGRPDNIVREKGWAANWKHAETSDRAKYLAVGAAIFGGIALAVLAKRALRED